MIAALDWPLSSDLKGVDQWQAPCATAFEEMLARVNGQYGNWHDPHNNGTYSVLASQPPGTLALSRRTGDGKYTDKLTFTFADASSSTCSIAGCSESQVTSVADFSTNYCNLRMLYCGAVDGCSPVVHDFVSSEEKVQPSVGASSDRKACLKV